MARFGHLNPYDLHKRLINDYVLQRSGDTKLLNARDTTNDRTDADVIRENHKFLWDDDAAPSTWEKKLAKKYYDKLFTEYCICDLSRYRENKVALRWRIEVEVVSGKGQFICGNKVCTERETLRSWEVNFAYKEHDEQKNALVKLRLCPDCSFKLNYHSKKREVKKLKKLSKRKKKSKRRRNSSESSSLETPAGTSSPRSVVNKNSSTDDFESETDLSKNEKSTSKEPETEDDTTGNNWSKKSNSNLEEKSREEEFDEYLEDLLL